MRQIPRRLLAAGGILLAAGLLVPAAADWLVTRDGSRVETVGPWRVESRLVVFKRPDGTLGSLRLSEVDLEASRRLTDEAAARETAPPPEKTEKHDRPVIARLTERDLPPVGETEKDRPQPATAEETGRQEASALDVTSFQELSSPSSDGVAFRGTVRNGSDHMAVGIAVSAIVYDGDGDEVRRVLARLTSTALPSGQSAGFRADFPGVYHYGRVQFDVTGNLLETAPPEGTEPPSGAGG